MKIRKIAVFSLISLFICTMVFGGPQQVYAGSANVSVSLSAGSVTTGGTVTVTIGISADEPIGYGVAVSYNPAVLEYQGGGDGGGGGTVTILNEGDGSTSSFSRTLTFKAIGNGSSSISTSAFAGGLFGYSTGDMAVSYGSATVTVSAPQAPSGGDSGNSGGGSGSDSNNATEAPLSGSDDNYLKSLEISPGTLSPVFQSGTTSYTVELPEDTTEIVVSAVPRDSKAKVSVSHHNDLEPGANKTYIVVTAENGTQRTYVLNVYCGEVEEETEASPITIDGVAYAFATEEQMEGVTVPEGFTTAEAEYEDGTITVYLAPNQLFQIVYMLNEEEQGQWFVYNTEDKTFTLYQELQANANRYVILVPDDTITIPEGFQSIEIEIQGRKVTAYANPENTELVLLYMMNISGETGWYWYDSTEETYLRYIESEPTTEEVTTTEVTTTEAPVVTEDEKLSHLRMILYVLSGVSVLLLGTIVGIVVYYKKRPKMQETSGSSYEDLDK